MNKLEGTGLGLVLTGIILFIVPSKTYALIIAGIPLFMLVIGLILILIEIAKRSYKEVESSNSSYYQLTEGDIKAADHLVGKLNSERLKVSLSDNKLILTYTNISNVPNDIWVSLGSIIRTEIFLYHLQNQSK